jgi:hypothetical protein
MPEFEKKRKTESRMVTEGCLLFAGIAIVGTIGLIIVIKLYNNWKSG